MVGDLEIDEQLARKEKVRAWWKKGGKLQIFIALVLVCILGCFSHNSLVVGCIMCGVSLLGFSKLFFKNEHKYFVFIMSVWIFYKGIAEILGYFRRYQMLAEKLRFEVLLGHLDLTAKCFVGFQLLFDFVPRMK